jgi:malate synthase
VKHAAKLPDGRMVTKQMVKTALSEELDKLRQQKGEERFNSGKLAMAGKILDALMTGDKFQEFLTLVAYEHVS